MKTDPLSERVNKVLDEVFALRGEIFETGNLSACCWLYTGLNEVAADLALMKSAWLPENPEGLPPDDGPVFDDEIEIELPLELEEPREPAKPKTD